MILDVLNGKWKIIKWDFQRSENVFLISKKFMFKIIIV